MNNTDALAGLLERFIALSVRELPDDVLSALAEARSRETDPLPQAIYAAYFENFAKARELRRPACQDTGMPCFYLEAGTHFPYLDDLEAAIAAAVRQATASVPLRPNAVDFFRERNTGDNTGERAPWIHWDLVPGSDRLRVTLYFAGAGCALPGNAKVFKPAEGYPAMIRQVYDTVAGLGTYACPPLIVGVGLAATMENAAYLSKKALLRKLGTHHPDPQAARLEAELLAGLNKLGVGAQGLPGHTLALAVHIESAARHTASFASAVSVSCYTHRRGTLVISPDLSYVLEDHQGASL